MNDRPELMRVVGHDSGSCDDLPIGRPAPSRCLVVWLVATGPLAASAWLLKSQAVLAVTPGPHWGHLTLDVALARIAAVVLLGTLCWIWVVTTTTVGELLLPSAGALRWPPSRRTAGAVEHAAAANVHGVTGAIRRIILLACGVGLAVSAVSPTQAATPPPSGTESRGAQPSTLVVGSSLTGLPLPDRPFTPLGTPPTRPSDKPLAKPSVTAPVTPTGVEQKAPLEAPQDTRQVHSLVTAPIIPRSGHPERSASAPGESVLVRPGDTLWSISAQRLETTDPARISADWQRLYQLNHATIGPDPDLLHPGQQLVLPPKHP